MWRLDINDMEGRKVDLRRHIKREQRRFQKANRLDDFEDIVRAELPRADDQQQQPGLQVERVDEHTVDKMAKFLASLIDKCQKPDQFNLLESCLRKTSEYSRRQSLAKGRALEPFCISCLNSYSSSSSPPTQPADKQVNGVSGGQLPCSCSDCVYGGPISSHYAYSQPPAAESRAPPAEQPAEFTQDTYPAHQEPPATAYPNTPSPSTVGTATPDVGSTNGHSPPAEQPTYHNLQPKRAASQPASATSGDAASVLRPDVTMTIGDAADVRTEPGERVAPPVTPPPLDKAAEVGATVMEQDTESSTATVVANSNASLQEIISEQVESLFAETTGRSQSETSGNQRSLVSAEHSYDRAWQPGAPSEEVVPPSPEAGADLVHSLVDGVSRFFREEPVRSSTPLSEYNDAQEPSGELEIDEQQVTQTESESEEEKEEPEQKARRPVEDKKQVRKKLAPVEEVRVTRQKKEQERATPVKRPPSEEEQLAQYTSAGINPVLIKRHLSSRSSPYNSKQLKAPAEESATTSGTQLKRPKLNQRPSSQQLFRGTPAGQSQSQRQQSATQPSRAAASSSQQVSSNRSANVTTSSSSSGQQTSQRGAKIKRRPKTRHSTLDDDDN